jgi:hypothetical protein
MESERCPGCGRATVVAGSVNFPVEGHARCGSTFVPRESPAYSSNVWVFTTGVYHACVSCGHLWSAVDAGALRRFIQVHGNELAKQQLDEFVHGPYRGLPDLAFARDIGDRVAEVDASMLSGKPGAVGRYRDLKGVTWDQALKDMKNWRDLRREEKLALFGWEPKKKEPVDDLASPYF